MSSPLFPLRYGRRFMAGAKMKRTLLAIFLLSAMVPNGSHALEPHEVLVVANRRAKGSTDLAAYYMDQRRIPRANLLEIDVKESEVCSHTDYKTGIAGPVRHYLRDVDNRWRIRCVVLMYGVPLKIESVLGTRAEKSSGNVEVETVQADVEASVDSELALVLFSGYPLGGWIPNPLCTGSWDEAAALQEKNLLMVSRLDGASRHVVKRIIDDSLRTEKWGGLRGNVYLDARWPEDRISGDSAYRLYDQSLHQAAAQLQGKGMKVFLDESESLFQKGDCKNVALYCGWYSLANYIDAFYWRPGSIGYHIASAECNTLKREESRVWCKKILEMGAAATLGPVGEPYVNAFPLPEPFFRCLTEGNTTLAECYQATIPHFSWKMVLVGDPLYCPFGGANP